MKYEEIKHRFPKIRPDLPEEYKKIWDEHYLDSRKGRTKVTNISSKMEGWLHRKVSKTASENRETLEIGGGTLNQLNFENTKIYDVVEPQHMLYEKENNKNRVRHFYDDISDIKGKKIYDRIISVATFEHICDLPDVIQRSAELLKENGIMSVSIPNEGRFLWHFAYTMTTGIEFKKKWGLDYEIWMRYEHVNTADEIEILLRHYFDKVKVKYCGIGRTFSFYRYYECENVK